MEILAASAAAAEQRLQEAKEEGQTAMAPGHRFARLSGTSNGQNGVDSFSILVNPRSCQQPAVYSRFLGVFWFFREEQVL